MSLRAVALVALLAACGGNTRPPVEPALGRMGHPIVGGTVDPGDPAVVGLADSSGFVFCSGTLVDATHVVTAAHCVDPSSPISLVFICDDSNTKTPGSDPACFLPASGAVANPTFNASTLTDDIAVVTLASPASITPIAIGPLLPASAVGGSVRVVGYGLTSGSNQNSGGAKYSALSPVTYVGPVTSPNAGALILGQFEMAGYPGTCNGDSGGPALWPSSGSNQQLVGVTSWGDNACTQFGVDTNVAHYGCWLRQQGITAAPCGGADGGCTPACSGKSCGSADGCGATCQPGSGCTTASDGGCVPSCGGKPCGAGDGCGSICQPGSGCTSGSDAGCVPVCTGKACGLGDGCGQICQPGSGCTSGADGGCVPACAGKTCGASNGCGNYCLPGSGCNSGSDGGTGSDGGGGGGDGGDADGGDGGRKAGGGSSTPPGCGCGGGPAGPAALALLALLRRRR